MQVWCVGAGSVGMLFTAKLALSGVPVNLVTRSEEQADAINEAGIQLLEDESTQSVKIPAYAYHNLVMKETTKQQAGISKADWIFLTVKQLQLTDSFLATIGDWCKGGARLLCFQNGIGHRERLLKYVEAHQLDMAVTTEGARKQSPVEIRHTGNGITRIGSGQVLADSEIASKAGFMQKKLIVAMQQAGFESYLSNNMKEIAWNKLLMNAVINPLTAILHCRNGQLLESAPLMPLMRALFDEGVLVARSQGVGLQEGLWDQLLEVCRKTANNNSSMLQDLTAGRTTELEWLNGALLKAAQEQSISLPANETVYRLVKALEKQKCNVDGINPDATER